MKVLMCSRSFPAGHPREGQPTHFVEKIMAGLADHQPGWAMYDSFVQYDWYAYYNCTMPKGHTIRAGSRFKPGDMASLRIWSDKPYRSKQIEFAQVEVKATWDIQITMPDKWIAVFILGKYLSVDAVNVLAHNDGLEPIDFFNWFSIHPKKTAKAFTGQVISWSSEIDYTPKLFTAAEVNGRLNS